MEKEESFTKFSPWNWMEEILFRNRIGWNYDIKNKSHRRWKTQRMMNRWMDGVGRSTCMINHGVTEEDTTAMDMRKTSFG